MWQSEIGWVRAIVSWQYVVEGDSTKLEDLYFGPKENQMWKSGIGWVKIHSYRWKCVIEDLYFGPKESNVSKWNWSKWLLHNNK